ncbi:MAG: hypothetical protein MRJ65_05955 [Candidatus Brocadiaceae bacterium]|nr:hypothetical protein [Candidatus Brocadiaceae bacterium]
MFKRSNELFLNDMLDSIQAIEDFIRSMSYDQFLNDRKTATIKRTNKPVYYFQAGQKKTNYNISETSY